MLFGMLFVRCSRGPRTVRVFCSRLLAMAMAEIGVRSSVQQIVFCSSSWLLSLPASVSKSRGSVPGMAWGDLRFSWPSFSSSRRLSSSSSSCNVAQRRSVPELYEGIAKFYDNSSGVWEDMWGEHMHHGYYDTEGSSSQNDHLLAQIAMIENSLAFAQVPDSKEERPVHVVDVGCGIGGSARYLARKYEAKVSAITLSPVQAARGNVITASQGLSNLVTLQVENALKQPFEDGTFDLVWSMESGEHMPDKQQFVGELARVAAPGGRIIIVTWCHRNLEQGETCLKPKEQELLDKICDAYYLPAWCSPLDYVELLKTLELEDIKYADWSKNVTPFWPAVVASALSFRGLIKLATSGWTTIRGALAMTLMVQGYQVGLIKFAIITARKPL